MLVERVTWAPRQRVTRYTVNVTRFSVGPESSTSPARIRGLGGFKLGPESLVAFPVPDLGEGFPEGVPKDQPGVVLGGPGGDAAGKDVAVGGHVAQAPGPLAPGPGPLALLGSEARRPASGGRGPLGAAH